MHPVEGVGEVDEAALRPNGGDRVGEREAARDLLLEEEADHLALAVGLHLLAGDHGQAAAACESTASSAPPKRLWSVTAIAPRPIASRVVDQILDGDRTVV